VGWITYDTLIVQLDDRALTHLQIVIVNKLRKGENFLMSWKDAPDVGDGRSAVWMHQYMLLHFKFDGSRVPEINQEWLAELTASADSSRGLIVTAEKGQVARVVDAPRRAGVITRVAPAKDADTLVQGLSRQAGNSAARVCERRRYPPLTVPPARVTHSRTCARLAAGHPLYDRMLISCAPSLVHSSSYLNP
jgi:hypothetical protein